MPSLGHCAKELQQGFGQALLTLLAGEQLTAQAAAIYLKNFLQRRWQSLEDRESLRDALVPATLNADRLVRKQLCAAVEDLQGDLDLPCCQLLGEQWNLLPPLTTNTDWKQELALQDPEHWPALLPQLVSATAGMVSATAGIGASGTAQCQPQFFWSIALEVWCCSFTCFSCFFHVFFPIFHLIAFHFRQYGALPSSRQSPLQPPLMPLTDQGPHWNWLMRPWNICVPMDGTWSWRVKPGTEGSSSRPLTVM